MKTWVAIGSILLSSAAYAQQQQEDPVERSLQRVKDSLRDQPLTEEQTSKIRDILKRQNDDLRSVLTDAQKTALDQSRGRGGQGGQGNFTGFRGGAWYPSTDEMKTQLSLTEDQVTKINEVRDGVRQNIRNFFQNRQRGGNPADEWNAFQEKSREESIKKIRDLLTDEQKPKFDEIVKTFAANPQPNSNNSGGNNNRGRGGPSIDERVGRVMADLKVEDAKEAEAIKSVVKKVIEIMERLDTYQREARTKIDDASRNKELSDDAVGDRISEIMKGMKELEKELSAARKELTEIVTNRQELELLRQRILR